MNEDKRAEQMAIDKFRLLYAHTQGGIFSQKTRERIMTKKGLSGRSQTINTFWYRQRENVKTALIDLRLFIEQAGESNVNRVVTAEALRPIVHSLLYRPLVYEKAPAQKRAELARWFIEMGFEYLKAKSELTRLPQVERGIDDALKLASALAEHLERGKNVEG